LESRLTQRGIEWERLTYHRTPGLLAKVWDRAAGARRLRRMLRTKQAGLVHARGYLPMEIALAASVDVPLLFDIRGLQPEEYVEGGLWKETSLRYRLAKRSEARF